MNINCVYINDAIAWSKKINKKTAKLHPETVIFLRLNNVYKKTGMGMKANDK